MSTEILEIVQQMDLHNAETQLALQCAPLIAGVKISLSRFNRHGGCGKTVPEKIRNFIPATAQDQGKSSLPSFSEETVGGVSDA
mgnify:CR=1 FL=1